MRACRWDAHARTVTGVAPPNDHWHVDAGTRLASIETRGTLQGISANYSIICAQCHDISDTAIILL